LLYGSAMLVSLQVSVPSKVEVSDSTKHLIIGLMVVYGVIQLVSTLVKVYSTALKNRKYLPSCVLKCIFPKDQQDAASDSDRQHSANRLDLLTSLFGIMCAILIMVSSASQQNDVVGVISNWRTTIGLTSFDSFVSQHVRADATCPTPKPSYAADVCACLPDGPCSGSSFVDACGLNPVQCPAALKENCACDLALYGYKCSCSISLSGCSIDVLPNHNTSVPRPPPFLSSAEAGFNQCLDHYDSVKTLLTRTMRSIIIVGCIACGMEALRLLVYFVANAHFEWFSLFSSVVGVVCTIVTGVLIGKVSSLSLDSDACTNDYLVQELPGCMFTNMGVVGQAEGNLHARISECVLIFIAKPVQLALSATFTALQQLPHFGVCTRLVGGGGSRVMNRL